jgi:hypothetical protein
LSGLGDCNGFAPDRTVGHGAACSEILFKVFVKAKPVPLAHRFWDLSIKVRQLQWQAADRHQACNPNNCRRADHASSSTDD